MPNRLQENPPTSPHRRGKWSGRLLYPAIALVSVAILTLVLQLWHADGMTWYFSPMEGDDYMVAAVFRTVVDHGWLVTNPNLGAPGESSFIEFPFSQLFILFIRFLSIFTTDIGVISNTYFILTFPLAALLALYSLRSLGVSPAPSVLAALLYAFLPCNLLKGQGLPSTYFIVPLMCLVLIRADQGAFVLDRGDGNRVSGRSLLAPLVISVLLGLFNVYYASFALLLLLVVALRRSLRPDPLQHLFVAGILAFGVMFSAALNLVTPLLYSLDRGMGLFQRLARSPGDAELMGGKIAQFLLPVTDHRIGLLADLKKRYNALAPLVNENEATTLGLMAGVGFLLLLLIVLQPQLVKQRSTVWSSASAINLAAVLIGTIGGFGSLIAFVVSPQVRGYNRIVDFVGFFSLLALGLALDELGRRTSLGHGMRLNGLCVCLGVVGILDSTTPTMVPDYEGIRGKFNEEQRFFKRIEQELPSQAMVFQSPYAPFPEPPSIHGMAGYSHLRGYLNSPTLRWSYGSTRGSWADEWQHDMAAKSPGEMVKSLVFAGFQGVYIDRFGLEDRGRQLVEDLTRILGADPIESDPRRYAFFELLTLETRLKERLAPSQWQFHQNSVLPAVRLHWGRGFSLRETHGTRNIRWSASASTVLLENREGKPKWVNMAALFAPGRDLDAGLRIEGPNFSEELRIVRAGTGISKTFLAPPGNHTISFIFSGRELEAPNDHRELAFLVEDFRLRETLEEGAEPTRVFSWAGDFFGEERDARGRWRWCGKRGTLRLFNFNDRPVVFEVEGVLRSGAGEGITLQLHAHGFSRRLRITPGGQAFRQVFSVDPGEYDIEFFGDGKPALVPGDPRELMFRFDDFYVGKPRPSMQIEILWIDGCYGREQDAYGNWHWCGSRGAMLIDNPDKTSIDIEVEALLRSGTLGGADVRIRSTLFSENLRVSPAGTTLHRVFTVPPGKHRVELESEGPAVVAPNDPRELVFRVDDFRFHEAGDTSE